MLVGKLSRCSSVPLQRVPTYEAMTETASHDLVQMQESLSTEDEAGQSMKAVARESPGETRRGAALAR